MPLAVFVHLHFTSVEMNAVLSPAHPSTVTSCKRDIDVSCAGLGFTHLTPLAREGSVGRAGHLVLLGTPAFKHHVRYWRLPVYTTLAGRILMQS